jgi:sensor domain CHASE-containing protein
MRLRTKSLIVICIGFSIFSLLLALILNTIVIGGYTQLEATTVSEHITRVLNQLQQEYQNLESVAWDWSVWDDTYLFVENKNEEYIQKNIEYAIFEDIKINFMIFYNSTDSLVLSQAYDFQQQKETALPPSLFEYLSKNHDSILDYQNIESAKIGILCYSKNETPLLVAITPILQSNKDGPIHGSLIVGRFLDDWKIGSLANITQLAVTLHPISNPPSLNFTHPSSYLINAPIIIKPINSTYVAGYININDIFGNPVFILEVGSSRDIYNQGVALIQTLLISLITSVIILIILMVIILDRFITSRLTSLSNYINKIKNYSDLSIHRQIKGNDEIAVLEKSFNDMLTSLQKTWTMKDSAELSLQKKIDELERFKTITIDREIKMINLKKQINELKALTGDKELDGH